MLDDELRQERGEVTASPGRCKQASRRSGGARVATLGRDLHQVLGEIAAGKVEAEDGMRQDVPDWHV